MHVFACVAFLHMLLDLVLQTRPPEVGTHKTCSARYTKVSHAVALCKDVFLVFKLRDSLIILLVHHVVFLEIGVP